MESEILVQDEKSLSMAIDAFCKLGSDGGLGEGRIWVLLDPTTKRAKTHSPDNMSISELIGIDTTKMMSILGGGRKWKSKFQSGAGVGRGLHTLMQQGSHWVTVGSSVTMNGDTPDNGYLIERGSDDAILIKAKIYSKLRQEADKDNTTPLLSKELPAAELDSPSKDLSAAELDLPVATPSPKQTEMSNSNKRKALSDKSLEDTEEGSPDNTDKVIDDTMNDISDRLLVELEKQLSKLSSMPDIRLQSFSQSILARCLARSTASNGVIKLSSVDERNHVLSNTYMKMPSRRVCNPSSTKESKTRFAKEKAKLINTFIDSILDTHSDHGKEMTYRVLRKVADQREMVVLKRERVELSIEEVVSIRDIVGTGTNGICRFASALSAMRPDLFIFPTCLKGKLGQFEGEGNLDLDTVLHALIVTKDGTKNKYLPYMYLKKPWQLLELMIEKSVADCTFEMSETWMRVVYKDNLTSVVD